MAAEAAATDIKGASQEEEVRSDPGVALATRVLGGDVVAVRPDGGD
jgi:hypothetical protein